MRPLRVSVARPNTPISDEVWARYFKQVEESEGFDVDPFPGINEHVNIVKPIRANKEYFNTYLLSAIAARNKRNKRKKDADGKKIELVRTITINGRRGGRDRSLYFTFVAKCVADGTETTYQARVDTPFAKNRFPIFREKASPVV